MSKNNLFGIKPVPIKVDQNNPYMQEAARVMRRGQYSQYIFPNDDGTWTMKQILGNTKTKIFENLDDAILEARKIAKKYHCSLFVHENTPEGDLEITKREDYWIE